MTSKPGHIAIIMDGNRRWAKARQLEPHDGHKQGGLVAKSIIKEAVGRGIKYLTLYTFSSENWRRSDFEISNFMRLLEFYLANNSRLLLENNIKFCTIGDISKLSTSIQKKITEYENLTMHASGLNLIIALNYGSRLEIVDSCRKIYQELQKGNLQIEEINEQKFAEFLQTKNIPDPDLLIRTGGEQRISNFLLWQIAYTELYFTNKLWPDFTKEDLDEAIKSFGERKRKYGAE